MPITDWPLAERPREKLMQMGAHSLSDAELLAIFLRTGVRGQTAVDLARGVLQQFKGLHGLLMADVQQFCQQRGLGSAKYVLLQACLEMARRYLYTNLRKGQALSDPQTAACYLLSQLRHQTREVFAALFLDNQHRVLAYEELFFGTIREITVYPRELVKQAMRHNAAAIIVAHNHPSGDISPSEQDKDLTKKLRDSLSLIDINLLDHMIIGDGAVFSFVQEGLLV